MSDKSPRSNMSKKPGKSLKEKRADKRTKADTTSATEDAIRKKRRFSGSRSRYRWDIRRRTS